MAKFDGAYYDTALDEKRLTNQMQAVLKILSDGNKYTVQQLSELAAALLGKPVAETSISAQLRNLRKEKHGSHDIVCERKGESGTFTYRLVEPEGTGKQEKLF